MYLSIIIPVYKVKDYLNECLKSIVNQRLNDYEVILVDDCSPDDSGNICDAWTDDNSHFKVIHHSQNKGLSASRNSGLNIATGTYITFIDSDDFIAAGTLKANLELLAQDKNIDVLEYPILINHGSDKAYKFEPSKVESVTFIEWIKQKGYLHSYACNKIFKRELWKDARFPEGKLFEDMFTIPSVMSKAIQILRSDKGLYYYCYRKGSISNKINPKGVADLLEANLHLYNLLSPRHELTTKDLDDLYLHLCDPQIVHIQMGGKMLIPSRNISLRNALFTQRPFNYHLKAILKALFGDRYCHLIAKTRKHIKR